MRAALLIFTLFAPAHPRAICAASLSISLSDDFVRRRRRLCLKCLCRMPNHAMQCAHKTRMHTSGGRHARRTHAKRAHGGSKGRQWQGSARQNAARVRVRRAKTQRAAARARSSSVDRCARYGVAQKAPQNERKTRAAKIKRAQRARARPKRRKTNMCKGRGGRGKIKDAKDTIMRRANVNTNINPRLGVSKQVRQSPSSSSSPVVVVVCPSRLSFCQL